MNKTLTIRMDQSQDKALTARAAALGKSRSELVRELIARGLEERPLEGRVGHLRGRLAISVPKTGWGRRIKDRNWR